MNRMKKPLRYEIAQWGDPFIILLIYIGPGANRLLNDFIMAGARYTTPR